MSVVVSDTSPLHYLILCDAVQVLPQLFERVFIPPTVFAELQHVNTPSSVRAWAQAHPSWVEVRRPLVLDSDLRLHLGEIEAISLAREVNAAAILMDDRAARTAAARCGLLVTGTVGILESAAMRSFINLPDAILKLQQTNARLDPELIRAALERHAARRARDPS